MIFKVDTNKPFHKSSGIINLYIKNALQNLDFKVCSFHEERTHKISHGERLIPISNFQLLHQVLIAEIPDITFYDDLGLGIKTPLKMANHRNILFFHGLRGFPGTVLGNSSIDLYCCNSKYLESLLSSFMLFPDFKKSKVLDAKGAASTTFIRLPVPMLDYPDGYLSEGENLPSSVFDALRDGSLIGHSIQRDKPSPTALLYIMRSLNQIAKKEISKTCKLVVSQAIIPEIASLAKTNFPLNHEMIMKWFIPVPLLKNSELLFLMKESHFGLCYNRVPESFGIYPLESVLAGCPIYTNGVGNNRYLLPPQHGIVVYESELIEFYKLEEYHNLAVKIFDDIVTGDAVNKCQYGVKYINQNHSGLTFENDMKSTFNILEQQKEFDSSRFEFNNLVFKMSPLVRFYNSKTGYVISDYKDIVICSESISLIKNVLGKTADCISQNDHQTIKNLTNLFYQGVIALQPKYS